MDGFSVVCRPGFRPFDTERVNILASTQSVQLECRIVDAKTSFPERPTEIPKATFAELDRFDQANYSILQV